MLKKILIGLLILVVLLGIVVFVLTRGSAAELSVDEVSGTKPTLVDADSEMFPTVRIASPIGWEEGEKPTPAKGLAVQRFAEGLDHPRVLYTLPNGDILVTLTNRPASEEPEGIGGAIMKFFFSQAGAGKESANQLVLLRDADEDGVAEVREVLRDDLDSPSGIAWRDGTLYITNHNALISYAYELGASTVTGDAKKLMDLPKGSGHWMRNFIVDEAGENIYITVGSHSNIGEAGPEIEEGRAMIWEYNIASGGARQYAVGLRNANGLDFNPLSGELWTTVNERDMLGGDLVPDYLTNVPVGAQYGWPWLYWGKNLDMRVDTSEYPKPRFIEEYTRRPEYALGPHVAALGLTFAKEGHRMGPAFANGAFIARHGSWNRKPPSGYDVVFVGFDERGSPLDEKPVPVLTDFLTGDGETRGRPTWVTFGNDGSLLVSDDTAGIIWRVIAPEAEPAPKLEREKVESLPPQRELRGDPSAAFSDDYARETGGN